jgi:hypothetical protein
LFPFSHIFLPPPFLSSILYTFHSSFESITFHFLFYFFFLTFLYSFAFFLSLTFSSCLPFYKLMFLFLCPFIFYLISSLIISSVLMLVAWPIHSKVERFSKVVQCSRRLDDTFPLLSVPRVQSYPWKVTQLYYVWTRREWNPYVLLLGSTAKRHELLGCYCTTSFKAMKRNGE